MLKLAALNVGSPPGVRPIQNAAKPLILGTRQPAPTPGAAPAPSPDPTGQSQDPNAMPVPDDAAGAAIQAQDFRKGQEAIQELASAKQQIASLKDNQNRHDAASSSFVGSQLAKTNKSLQKLNQDLLSMKFAAETTQSPTQVVGKPPPLAVTPEQWSKFDAASKNRDTSLLTHAIQSWAPKSVQEAYEAPRSWLPGGGSLSNAVEGANKVLGNGGDAWHDYGLDTSGITGTSWSESAKPNTLRSMLGGAVDGATGLLAKMVRGAPSMLADAGSFAAGPLGTTGEALRSVGQLGYDASQSSTPILDQEFGKDIGTDLGDRVSNLGRSGANFLATFAPGAGMGLRAVGAGLGSWSAAPAEAAPAQPAPVPSPSPTAPPAAAVAAPGGLEGWGSSLMAGLAKLWEMIQSYQSKPDSQRDLPSAVGASGHAVRNPQNYLG